MPRYGGRYDFIDPYASRSVFDTANQVAGETIDRIRMKRQQDRTNERLDRAEGRDIESHETGMLERGWRPAMDDDAPRPAAAPMAAQDPSPEDYAANEMELRRMGPGAAGLLRRSGTTSGEPARTETGTVPTHTEVGLQIGRWRLDPTQTPGAVAHSRNRDLTKYSHELNLEEADHTTRQAAADRVRRREAFVESQVALGTPRARAVAQFEAESLWDDTPTGLREQTDAEKSLAWTRAAANNQPAARDPMVDINAASDDARMRLTAAQTELGRIDRELADPVMRANPEGRTALERRRAYYEDQLKDANDVLGSVETTRRSTLRGKGVTLAPTAAEKKAYFQSLLGQGIDRQRAEQMTNEKFR